jgi:hypothetical protein
MCKTLNLIHHQKAVLDITNSDIADSMTRYLGGDKVSKEGVGHYFTGNSGVPIEKIGALFDALGLKVVVKGSHEISDDELKALKLFAQRGLSQI